jgi:hypothetical protein
VRRPCVGVYGDIARARICRRRTHPPHTAAHSLALEKPASAASVRCISAPYTGNKLKYSLLLQDVWYSLHIRLYTLDFFVVWTLLQAH